MLPVLLVIAIGIASTAVIVAALLALVRSLKSLSGSVARFREDVQPMLDDVHKETERSREVLERISSRQIKSRPGGRLRR